MKYLHIAPIGGMFHELYYPEDIDLSHVSELEINNNCLDANNLFWSQILDIKHIKKILRFVEISNLPQYVAIKGDSSKFLRQVNEAKLNLCNHLNDTKDFYRYLETLSIVCKLYSDFKFNPYNLTLQQGFVLEESSAKILYKNCLNSETNPYFNFVCHFVMPVIHAENPQIVFIDGAPSLYNMAICRLLKTENPNIHICITRHSTEYFSLNKLEKHLLKNTYLFYMVDSIILEYFEQTEQELLSNIKNNKSLRTISNLLYKDNLEIVGTGFQMPLDDFKPEISITSPSRALLNVHLQKYIKCYWNKCTFCGINKKYHFRNIDESDGHIYDNLHALSISLSDTKYIWFIDEAIAPQKLKKIADFFLEKHLHIKWQARCRIENELLNDALIDLLYRSGLRELRLGLESASIEILKRMNKFEQEFSFDVVEKICQKYSEKGISVHFPIIIGFPGETDGDRRKTFSFLELMHQRFGITFNINIFILDISSFVSCHPQQYDIQILDNETSLDDSLSNTLRWKRKDSSENAMLYRLRDQYMREILYPWMPPHSVLKPHIFYRLSETIRNTLIWKCRKTLDIEITVQNEADYILSNEVVIGFDEKRQIHIIYNWKTHHYIIGNEYMIRIVKLFYKKKKLNDAVQILARIDSKIFSTNDVVRILNKLITQKYIVLWQERRDSQ